MFRRSVFEKCGLYNETEKVRRCEDYELFVRLHILGCYGYNLQEKLICYPVTVPLVLDAFSIFSNAFRTTSLMGT